MGMIHVLAAELSDKEARQNAERQLDFPMDDDCIAPSMRLGDLA